MLNAKDVWFLPSQVDSTGSTTPLPYTGSPLALLWADILLFFTHIFHLPGLFLPLYPWPSAELDELYPSLRNLWEITLHVVLTVAQLLFFLSLPFCLLYPLVFVLAYVGGFIVLNRLIGRVLNGGAPFVKSNVNLDHLPKHSEEQWIFVNGVAAGRLWLQNNVNRLSQTFGREVLGVHNPTAGIIFDVVQCLLERDFMYGTQDVRNGFVLVRQALKDPKNKKVVLILHSQGGIEGGLMIDWMLADLPEICFRKLEVYTFASAANHFNNPIRSYSAENENQYRSFSSPNVNPNQRVIRYVEHYANSRDFVSRWGVLHFTQSAEHRNNRFIGRLFERNGSGHTLNQHYLDNMFPMDPSTGRVADSNEFMETLVDVDDSLVHEREPLSRAPTLTPMDDLPLDDAGQALSAVDTNAQRVRQRPVRELSRLWRYRNGGKPDEE